jgi:hypothetical protein
MFGQYSEAAPSRRTKADLLAGANPIGSPRVVGHNRLVWRDADGWIHYRLHQTDVVSYHATKNHLVLNDGGWPTMTTTRAMKQGLTCLFPLTCWNLWRERGFYRVSIAGGEPIVFSSRVTLDLNARGEK